MSDPKLVPKHQFIPVRDNNFLNLIEDRASVILLNKQPRSHSATISTCLISLSTYRQADSYSERVWCLAEISQELPHHKAFSIHLLAKACFKNRQDLDAGRVQVPGGSSLELPLPEGFQFVLTSLSLVLIIIKVYEQPDKMHKLKLVSTNVPNDVYFKNTQYIQ